jgi:hypothetical protein
MSAMLLIKKRKSSTVLKVFSYKYPMLAFHGVHGQSGVA